MSNGHCSAGAAEHCLPSSSDDFTYPKSHPVVLLVVSYFSFLEAMAKLPLITEPLDYINKFLSTAGVAHRSLITPEEMSTSIIATLSTLLVYYICFGKRNRRNRKKLTVDLRAAQAEVQRLEELLVKAQTEEIERGLEPGKEVRIFMDGAFDMMHYGHMNAFRQGRALGTHLVVGVNSDESILKCKGAPLMSDRERLTMVEGCKFVDEVVPGCPYIMNKDYLEYVIKHHNIDYVIHGDDPCMVDGKDVYAEAKAAGKFQNIPRTEGVSTTDIVGRMLLMSKDHHVKDIPWTASGTTTSSVPLSEQSQFLTTSRLVRLFSAGVKAPTKEQKVIYIDGAWDMFHCGHVSILKKAKQRGDYLIVGVLGDSVVNRVGGSNLPLMNLHERLLSILGCRFVDDVLIDAPYTITPEMIASLNIAEVVHGTCFSNDKSTLVERYKFPREEGILHTLISPSKFTLSDILVRIKKNQEEFQAKIDRKKKVEQEYYNVKYNRKVS